MITEQNKNASDPMKELQYQLFDSKIRGILSSLWIIVFINHCFMGLHEFANPGFIKQLIAGMDVSDFLLLFAAITIQPPIIMIVLSRALPNKINWIVNIGVAIYAIVLESSNIFLNGSPDLDNQFFFAVEIASFIAIIIISILWRRRLVKRKES